MNKKYQPLLIVIFCLLLFGSLIYYITRPSIFGQARKELKGASSYNDVKLIWRKYLDLKDKPDWSNLVENKLIDLNLNNTNVIDLKTWYPVRKHLNLIIVPDLSNRLKLPDQPTFDTTIINHIWKSFSSIIQSKFQRGQSMPDRIIVDVSDKTAAGGQFRKIADNLIFDLSSVHQNDYLVFLWTESSKFKKNIDQLYQLGMKLVEREEHTGADYREFFNQRAASNIKKSTPFDEYRNVAILLTDGYLEISNGPFYNGSTPIPINKSTNLNGLEIIMLEIDEREAGQYQIHKKLWYDWLSAMGAKVDGDVFFQRHNDASSKTKDIISEFLQVKSMRNTVQALTQEKPNPAQEVIEIKSETVKEIGSTTTSSINVSSLDLAKKYNKMGDEKCKGFKNAQTPHLYHIANEYYQQAALLTNSTPKVCE